MSLIIQITEDVRINCADTTNFNVEKRRIVEKGKNAGQEQWDTLGFFGSVGAAAGSLLKGNLCHVLGTASKDVTIDLKSLVLSVDEAADHIARACEDAAPKLLRMARTPRENNVQEEA